MKDARKNEIETSIDSLKEVEEFSFELEKSARKTLRTIDLVREQEERYKIVLRQVARRVLLQKKCLII